MQKRDFTTCLQSVETFVFGSHSFSSTARDYEINGIYIGHVIFSGLKITISSCLEAVVLIEAVIQ